MGRGRGRQARGDEVDRDVGPAVMREPPCGDGDREGDQSLGVVEVDIDRFAIWLSCSRGCCCIWRRLWLRLVVRTPVVDVQGVRVGPLAVNLFFEDSDLVVDGLSRGVQVAVRGDIRSSADDGR